MAWLDDNYLYRKKITIQNSEVAGDETDFPAVYSETDTDLTKALANGFDFKVSVGEDTEVPYERSRWNDATGEIILYIKTDPLAATDVDYYLYYGYAGETVDQQDRDAVWTNGFVGVWHMEEANIVDSSGTVADGTNNGTTNDTNGVIGDEREFDGIDDYIDMGDATNLDGATVCTFEAWIDAANWGGDAIMRKWTGGGQAYIFGLNGSDELQITIRDGSGGQLNTQTTNANLSTGTRYYVTGVWGGGNTRKFIIDGTIEPTMNDITSGNPTDIANVSENFAVGARYNGGSPDNFFDGQMDELRQSNVARSDNWIETTYNNLNAPSSFWVTGAEEVNPVEITHTTDSYLKAVETRTHTTNSVILGKIPVDHDTDSVLRGTDSESHDTDSILREIDNELTHTTDSFLLDKVELTHTTDSVLKALDTEITHTTDSVLKELDTEITHTTDSFLLDKVELTHTTDSVLKKITEITHTTDSTLKALDTEITHTTDSFLFQAGQLIHMTDSVLKKLDTELTHTTDSYLKAIKELTHTTDSYLKAIKELTHTTDSYLINRDIELEHTTDSYLINRDVELTHTTDSVLGEREPGFTVAHTTDSVLKALDTEITHTTDSVLKELDTEITHTTDSALREIDNELTHTTDSYLLDKVELTHTTDSVLGEREPGFTVAHTTDSVLKELDTELTHTTDSALREIDNELTHTTDSVLKALDTEITHTTDSFLSAENQLAHTTDSVLKALDTELTHTTDSVLKALDTELTHTTDSVLGEREPGFTVTHTTDSVLLAIQELTHTTDSVLAPSFVEITHTTDSLLNIVVELAHTTDSVLGEREPGFTVTHTTDCVLKALGVNGECRTELNRTTALNSEAIGANRIQRTNVPNYSADPRTVITHVGTFCAGINASGAPSVKFALYDSSDNFLGETVSTGFSDSDSRIGTVFYLPFTTPVQVPANGIVRPTILTSSNSFRRSNGTSGSNLVADETTGFNFTDPWVQSILLCSSCSMGFVIRSQNFQHACHTTDSLLVKVTELTHTTDSFLKAVIEITHTTDSVLGEREPGFTVTHTTDSTLKELDTEISHTTDSTLKAIFEITHTTDSLLKAVVEITHTTDSTFTFSPSVVHTTDSVIREKFQADPEVFVVYDDTPEIPIQLNDIEEISVVG